MTDGETAATAAAATAAIGRLRWYALGTFLRHQLSSAVSTIVDFGTMTMAVELLRASPVVGTLAGASAGALVNFQLGRRWIFAAAHRAAAPQALRYAVVSGLSAVFNAVGEYVLHDLAHIQYFAARAVIALIVSVAWNFPMQRRFVFAGGARR